MTISVRIVGSIVDSGLERATEVEASFSQVLRPVRTPCRLRRLALEARYTGDSTPPRASFEVSVPEQGGTTADFRDTSTDNGYIVAVNWDFGDPDSGSANVSTSSEPFHKFTRPGTYTVRLTVEDDLGLKSTASRQVTVTARETRPPGGDEDPPPE